MVHARLSTPAERARSAAFAALAVCAIGYALVSGLATGFSAPADDVLKVFGVAPPPPPPPEEKPPAPRRAAPKKEGRASPPNLKAKPVEIAAPPPVVPVPPPPPVVTAPKAGPGPDPSAGAAQVRGPGFGSGGVGDGTGSGGRGDGEGGGGGRDVELISPQPGYAQLSHAAKDQMRDHEVTVYASFVVGVKGRVTDCTIVRPSGFPKVDADTCRLFKERLRYLPELDRTGRPIPVTVQAEQRWTLARKPDSVDPYADDVERDE